MDKSRGLKVEGTCRHLGTFNPHAVYLNPAIVGWVFSGNLNQQLGVFTVRSDMGAGGTQPLDDFGGFLLVGGEAGQLDGGFGVGHALNGDFDGRAEFLQEFVERLRADPGFDGVMHEYQFVEAL